MTPATARLEVLAAALLFSTGGAAIKVDSFGAAQVSFLRSGIAALALIIWMRGRVRWSWPIVGTGVIYAAMLTLFVASTKLTTAANAIFLQSTAPLYLVILGPLVLRERFHRRDMALLAALAGGLACCFLGQAQPTTTAPDPTTGNLLGVASGIVWALTLMALRYVGRNDATGTHTLSAVVAGNTFASFVVLPVALPLPAAAAPDWLTAVYLGVFQIGAAYIFLSSAVRRLPALETSLLLLIEPVLNPVWTWLIRDENPGAWTIAGGAVIVAATAVRILRGARE